jgi:cytoskeleton protein RodZ
MAPSLGRTLRKARTERGVELSEVERATKIRAKFLQAMEEDRWEALPAPVYARGFLDIYARYLGLDEKALLDRYGETVEAERPEPIPDSVIKPGALRQHRPSKRMRMPSVDVKPVAKVTAVVLALIVVGLVIVGSIGGSDKGGGGEQSKGAKRGTKAAAPPASTTTAASGQVSLELLSTAPVWVCLVDESGNALVDGETLTANEARGPFNGGGFEVTFGNGSVEMTVDGEAAQVPAVAEPIGYRITPSGVRRLDPSAQPTCV